MSLHQENDAIVVNDPALRGHQEWLQCWLSGRRPLRGLTRQGDRGTE